jgi:predicted flap endonuclease-1-like 5' DNA nuclease
MDQAIETINGIGPVYGESLRKSGIKTVNDLVRVGATKRGRERLARKIGVTNETLIKWVYRGDLLRVNGIGKKYSTLLESAGVNTVTDLSSRNPRFLHQTLRTVNREKNLVRRTPPSKTIEIWVNNAKNLEPIFSP